MKRRFVAPATLLGLALTGCSGTATVDPTATATPTATTSPAPSPTSATDHATAAAKNLVHEYYGVLDRLATDPSAPLTELETVTTGDEYGTWTAELGRMRDEGWQQTGQARAVELVVQSADLSSTPTVVIDVCYDVSDVDVLDSSGASVVASNRPDRAWERLTAVDVDPAQESDDDWRVSAGETLEKEPCAAS